MSDEHNESERAIAAASDAYTVRIVVKRDAQLATLLRDLIRNGIVKLGPQ